MKRFVTTAAIVATMLWTVSALAFDVKAPVSESAPPHPVDFTLLTCDDGIEFSALFQNNTNYYGNVFNFGALSQLSRLEFYHCGWNTLGGPYNYNIELWDVATCTRVAQAVGKQAADAFNCSGPSPSVLEVEPTCNDNLRGSGFIIVAVNSLSCAVPTDCYPDVTFDDQIFVTCPYVVNPATPACTDLSGSFGPFMLRADLNGCQTPTQSQSWGGVKTLYR
jgi:hypothetical protein